MLVPTEFGLRSVGRTDGLSRCPSLVNDRKFWGDWIELPFGVVGRVGLSNHVLDGERVHIPRIRGAFSGEMGRLDVTYWENAASAVQKKSGNAASSQIKLGFLVSLAAPAAREK